MVRPQTPHPADDTTLTSSADQDARRKAEPTGAGAGVVDFDPSLAPGVLDAVQRELELLRRREAAHRTALDSLKEQLRQAGALQRNLLPSEMPEIMGLDVHVVYRPVDVLSGDSYDVVRLDAGRVAFSLADATGHGLPAALLSAFVKRSLQGTERAGDAYGAMAPDEVLARVNTDLLDVRLQECHFVAALYAVYDETTRVIRWARGGAPYPILVRPGGKPYQVISEGPLVGACEDPRFELVELQLEPGDTLLFHTDGLERLLLACEPYLGCCDLERTKWFRVLGRRPLSSQLEELETRFPYLSGVDEGADDVTLLVLKLIDP